MTQASSETSMASAENRTRPSFVEFVVIISMMMSLTALSIDAMLPALPQIGNDLRESGTPTTGNWWSR